MMGVMKKFLPLLMILLTVAGLSALGWWLLKDVRMDVLMPHGAVAVQQQRLLIFTVILSAVVVLPVFTLLGVFAWRYRAGNKRAKYRPHFSSSRRLEIVWWGIPIVIIAILGAVAWYTSHSLDPYRPLASENKTIEVQVIALQWKWLFLYPDEQVATLNQLVIPADTPVHFTLSADAPMSAFWIPALGSQIYAMNGMSSQLHLIADETGEYKGYSTNINGRGYADMTFNVHATSASKYKEWLQQAGQSPSVLTMNGYHLLAEPKSDRVERTYRLTDSQLYGKIMEMHMSGHSTEEMK